MAGRERFEGRAAFVTGGASGIGLAITRGLVAEGARVMVADVNPDSLASAQGEFGESIGTAEIDVRREDQVEAAVLEAESRFGGLHLAFNCAGLGTFGEVTELTEEAWDMVVDICLKGVFLSLKHEALAMRRTGAGSVVNISSLNCHVPMYGGSAYTSAKAGVEMLSRNAALELARDRIRVNTVSPGLTDTPLTAGFRDLQGAEQAFMARIPMQRWGRPEDMAAAALFLASDEAGYITGSNLVVDGGWETTAYPDLSVFRDAFLAADT